MLYGALAADSTGSSHPLTDRTANTPAEVAGMFSTISYDKVNKILLLIINKELVLQNAPSISGCKFCFNFPGSLSVEDGEKHHG